MVGLLWSLLGMDHVFNLLRERMGYFMVLRCMVCCLHMVIFVGDWLSLSISITSAYVFLGVISRVIFYPPMLGGSRSLFRDDSYSFLVMSVMNFMDPCSLMEASKKIAHSFGHVCVTKT